MKTVIHNFYLKKVSSSRFISFLNNSSDIKNKIINHKKLLSFSTFIVLIGLGYGFDKLEQKKIRKKWKKKVHEIGSSPLKINEKHKKIMIYMAPPPNDYIVKTQKLFKKYIKPILTESAIDFDVFEGEKQGDIRKHVANKLLHLKNLEAEEKTKQPNLINLKLPLLKTFKSYFNEKKKKKCNSISNNKSVDIKKIIGVYKLKFLQHFNDSNTKNLNNYDGVICLGRGVYKEYLNGIHDVLFLTSEQINDNNTTTSLNDFNELGQDYVLNSEIQHYLQKNPICVYPLDEIQGLINLPNKIYKAFTKRFLAEKYSLITSSIVYSKTRPFKMNDINLAIKEENNWPKKWTNDHKKKNSEWVKSLHVNKKVVELLRVFE